MSGRVCRALINPVDLDSGSRNARIGVLAWAVVLPLVRPGWPEAMLLLASLVVIPMGLGLVPPTGRESGPAWPRRAASRLQLPAALLLVASFALPAGPTAALLTLPWLGVTALVALGGMFRLRAGARTVAEVCLDAGLVYLAVGGAWAVISRAGLRPLGFPDVIVLMTAVHFHYAGFALPLLAGSVTRALGGTLASLAGLGVVAGVPLVAAGITDAQLAGGLFGPHRLELVASGLLAASAALVGLLQVRLAIRAGRPVLVRTLLAISGLAVLGPMALAGLYATGAAAGVAWVDFEAMARYHGAVNALGFALPGLLAWNLDRSISAREARP